MFPGRREEFLVICLFSKLMPALVLGKERDTDRQFPHQTHEHIALEQYMQGRAFQLP